MNLNHLIIREKASMKEAIEQIDMNRHGFVCVLGGLDKLIGTITDGDIRRALLQGFELSVSCAEVMNTNPVTVSVAESKETLLEIFKSKKIRNLPQVDEFGKLTNVITLNQLIEGEGLSVTHEKVAVIMAGGEGRRLRPYTENTPKPMLDLDGKPILEHIVLKLKKFGFQKFYISVNYLPDVIKKHFGDGSTLGVEINYLEEKEKLGTAGALSMLPQGHKGSVLVLNGDVVSDVNFQQLFEFHLDTESDFTMAASKFKFEIPFGVLKLDGEQIVGVDEKPTKSYLCNAGIYMLSENVVRAVPLETHFDMTELLTQSIQEKKKVKVFPLHECWLDVGRKEDLLKAKQGAPADL